MSMIAKSGWVSREMTSKLTVNDILQVLIVSKPSLRLCAFALKFIETLIEETFWSYFKAIFIFSAVLDTNKSNAKAQRGF